MIKRAFRGTRSKGLSYKDVVSKTSSSSKVSVKEYLEFWNELSIKSITELVVEIGNKLGELDKPDKKKSSSSSKAHALYALVATLDFVHLFLTIDTQAKLYANGKESWEKHRYTSSPVFDRFQKILRNINARYNQGNKLIDYSFVECAYDLERNDTIEQDFSFSYSYIRYFAHNYNENAGAELFDLLHKNLLALLKMSTKQASKSISTLMNLLHLLNELLVLWPPYAVTRETVGKIRDEIKDVLLLWPKPYCDFALQVVTNIESEMCNPGCLMRKRLVMERPDFVFGGPSRQEGENEVLAVYESHNPLAILIVDICKLFSDVSRQQGNVVTVKDFVESTLKTGMFFKEEVHHDVQKKLHHVIQHADEATVQAWAEKVQDQHDYLDTFNNRKQVLREVAADLEHSVFPNVMQGGVSNLAHWLEVPPCAFEANPLSNFINQDDWDGTPARPKYMIPMDGKKRILVIGGNSTVHQVVCSYVHLLQSGTPSQEIEFFLVPVERNDIGAFIALKDGWYRKFVYGTFSGPLKVCPPVEENGDLNAVLSSMQSGEMLDSTLSPLQIHATMISDYIQGATQTCHIKIFQVACWKDHNHSSQEEPDLIIPFVCRVEIGLNAAVARFVNSSDLDGASHRDRAVSSSSQSSSSSSSFFFLNSSGEKVVRGSTEWEDTLLDKHFVKSGIGPGFTPEVHVSMSGADLNGAPLPHSKELPPGPQPFQNASTQSPIQPWLEINWTTTKSAPNLSELLKKREKKSRDVEAIGDFIRTEQSQYFGRTVEVTSTKTNPPFYIAVDQQTFGPFYKIKVSPTEHKFKVKTFVPIV